MQTISRRKLVQELNKLCDQLDDKYDINLGGCCYLSYLIAKYLEKLSIPYELIIVSSEWKDKNYISLEIDKKRIHYLSEHSITGDNTCSHYYIHLKYIGSINPSNRRYSYTLQNIKSSNIKWVYDNGYWNDCYETRFNSTVGKIIKNFFKQYEGRENF